MARSLDLEDLAASALACTSFVHAHLGNFAQARQLAQEALECASADAPGRAEAYIALGICASETDDLDTAENCYRSAADLSRQLGRHEILVRALHDLSAGIYWPRGQFELAQASGEEALIISREYGISGYESYIWYIQADIQRIFGRITQARAMLEQLEACVSPGSVMYGYGMCLAAHLAILSGETEAAPAFLTRALATADVIGEPGLRIESRVGFSRYYRTLGDWPAASSWADTALTMARQFGYRHVEGRALIEKGRVAWGKGDLKAAEAAFHSTVEVLMPLKAAYEVANARLLSAALLDQLQRPDARTAWLEAGQLILEGGYTCLLEQERALIIQKLAAHTRSLDLELAESASRLFDQLVLTPPTPLRVFTLGIFEVYQNSKLVPQACWRQRQAGELFRLLLISPRRSLSREQVIEALWPEKSPGAARSFFHQATSALRRALEPDLPDKYPSRYLQVEEGQVTLRLPPSSFVDFEVFRQHLEKGEWQAGLSLFRGEPFPLDTYRDWSTFIREQLNQRYLEALLHIAQEKLAAGDPESAVTACQRLLTQEPCQEQAAFIGMQAYLALNDRTGAARLYRNLERVLREEFEIEPMQEIQQLYDKLR